MSEAKTGVRVFTRAASNEAPLDMDDLAEFVRVFQGYAHIWEGTVCPTVQMNRSGKITYISAELESEPPEKNSKTATGS